MAIPDRLQPVISHFFDNRAVCAIHDLGGAGGFSGARLWRIETRQEYDNIGSHYCLRRWPAESPQLERLPWMHHILNHVSRHSTVRIAAPIATRDGSTFVQHHEHYWELTPWIAGAADYHANPTPQRLRAAMTFLAEFHQLAVQAVPSSPDQIPDCIPQRLRKVTRLLQGQTEVMERALGALSWTEFSTIGRQVLSCFHQMAPGVRDRLAAWNEAVPVQPCIRDIWHDHLFFADNELVGVVDFGAMRIETVAADISRLLRSLVGDSTPNWTEGMDAYESRRSLNHAERRLVRLLDVSATLLSPLNWIEWIGVERRTFDDPGRVLRRFSETSEQLRQMLSGYAARRGFD